MMKYALIRPRDMQAIYFETKELADKAKTLVETYSATSDKVFVIECGHPEDAGLPSLTEKYKEEYLPTPSLPTHHKKMEEALRDIVIKSESKKKNK